MINAEQIRAARALLDWSTADLAKQAGLTVNGINKIERGHVQAHRDTLETLLRIFEEAGIEFLPGSGLRKKDRMVSSFEGEGAIQYLWDDIYTALKDKGGEVLIANVDEGKSITHITKKTLESHLQRLQNANITERLLIREGDENLIAPVNFYHAIEDQYFSDYPFYIYANKLALVSRQPMPKVIIISDERFSDSVKRLFNFVWDHTQIPRTRA